MNSPLGGEEGPSGIKTTLCPVCEEVIHGNGEELNSHVETCLRKVLTVSGIFDHLHHYYDLQNYFIGID